MIGIALPELPDLTVYLESLEARIANRRLQRIVLLNPFLLRTAVPPIGTAEGRTVSGLAGSASASSSGWRATSTSCCTS